MERLVKDDLSVEVLMGERRDEIGAMARAGEYSKTGGDQAEG